MTKPQIKKAATTAGINIDLIEIRTCRHITDIEMKPLPPDVYNRNMVDFYDGGTGSTDEVNRIIKKYNRQARKLVGVLKGYGMKFYMQRGGDGTNYYTTQTPTYSDYLCSMNID